MNKITISLTTLVFAVFAFALFLGFSVYNGVMASGASPADPECRITTNSTIAIGPSNSVSIVGTSSRRAYVRLQLNELATGAATSTVFLQFNDQDATVNSPVRLATSTNVFEAGLNTDFNYVGAIKAINSGSASTTLLVTDCVFKP